MPLLASAPISDELASGLALGLDCLGFSRGIHTAFLKVEGFEPNRGSVEKIRERERGTGGRGSGREMHGGDQRVRAERNRTGKYVVEIIEISLDV